MTGKPIEAASTNSSINDDAEASSARVRKTRSGSDNRRRQDGVFVRLSEDEFAILTPAAAAEGFSVAGYLRAGRLGNDAGGPRNFRRTLPKIDAAALARNNAELNRIGSNLNQTTRALNELALSAMNNSDGQLLRVIGELFELNQAIYRELTATLTANRRAFEDDFEG